MYFVIYDYGIIFVDIKLFVCRALCHCCWDINVILFLLLLSRRALTYFCPSGPSWLYNISWPSCVCRVYL